MRRGGVTRAAAAGAPAGVPCGAAGRVVARARGAGAAVGALCGAVAGGAIAARTYAPYTQPVIRGKMATCTHGPAVPRTASRLCWTTTPIGLARGLGPRRT